MCPGGSYLLRLVSLYKEAVGEQPKNIQESIYISGTSFNGYELLQGNGEVEEAASPGSVYASLYLLEMLFNEIPVQALHCVANDVGEHFAGLV